VSQVTPTITEVRDGNVTIHTPAGGLTKRELYAAYLVSAHLTNPIYLRKVHQPDGCCCLVDHVWSVAGVMVERMK